jgi:hypothetical protein
VAETLIQVCGDVTVDWLSVRDGKARLSSQAGRAALLSRLVQEIIPSHVETVQGAKIGLTPVW